MELRTCKTCGESKPLLTEYYLSGPNYRIPHCKDCYAKKKGTKRVKSWGKECIECKENKTIAEFGKEKKRGPKAVFDTCKECRDKAKAVPKGYKKCGKCKEVKPLESYGKCAQNKNGLKSPCKECERKRQSDPQYLKQQRDRNMLKKYGITSDQYDWLLAEQGGSCALPSCPITHEMHGKMLFVDHDHDHCSKEKGCLECIRGLLCMYHNFMIGHAMNDPQQLHEGADYLESNYRPFAMQLSG